MSISTCTSENPYTEDRDKQENPRRWEHEQAGEQTMDMYESMRTTSHWIIVWKRWQSGMYGVLGCRTACNVLARVREFQDHSTCSGWMFPRDNRRAGRFVRHRMPLIY